ncbi:ABC transporter ATP-binding protein [Desulfobacterales bacterium HSG16]|nr:ABC transporter ATP-binding protein [Desulfobacterales bacterium HSG16]
MISVENLVFEYPGKRALDKLSFQIPQGSITALVGPNGAGKTTLLKCMAALIKPFSGKISIIGIDVLKNPRECHRIIGFLPDFFGLYDSLRVWQVLSYFAMARQVQKEIIPGRVVDAAKKLGIEDRLNDRTGSLSRGMRQRLAIGQSLIHDPDVLLLDEPASGLDPESRYALSKLLLELNSEGKTLIVSSHILAELDEYANDLLILKDGCIVEHSISVKSHKKFRTIIIGLLYMPEDFLQVLLAMENVKSAEIITLEDSTSKDGASKNVRFDFYGDNEKLNELLEKLVADNYKICEFYIKHENVQEQYLKTIK